MWGSGPATISNYNTYVELLAFDTRPGLDLGVVEATAHMIASLGLNVGAHVNAGSVSAVSPFTATFDYAGTAAAGSLLRPTLSWEFGQGALSTYAPSVGAYADLVGNLFASVKVELCYVVDCSTEYAILAGTTQPIPWPGPSEPPPFWELMQQPVPAEFTQELAAFNRNNDGELRFLGAEVSLEGGAGPFSWDISLPEDASGTGTNLMHAEQSTNVLEISVDFAEVVTNALGLPPPNGSVGDWLEYNLFTAEGTLDTYFNQDFQLRMMPTAELHIEETGQDVHCSMVSGCGDIQLPTAGDTLTVTSMLMGGGYLSNRTGLQFAPGYNFSALSGSIFGAGFDPLIGPYDESFPLNQFDFINDSFPLLGFNSIAGPSFTIQIGSPDPVPEPASLIMLGGGLIGVAVWVRRKSVKGGTF
jgi:hypothetical protein